MRSPRLPIRIAILAVLLLACEARALDLTGKWRFEFDGIAIVQTVQITQSGSTISFALAGLPFSGSVSPAGSFTSYSATAMSPLPAGIAGRVMPSGNLLDGRIAASFPTFSVGGVVAARCTCDDGNATSGDGCDAGCQVEPCWTCAGDPSVCSPASDGTACEDGSPCTAGQTCSGGACVGGTPVAPCVDMTGRWNRHAEAPGVSPESYDAATDVTQRGTDVIFRDPVSHGPGYVGTIDPATGAFDLRVPNFAFFCFGFDPLVGSVAPTGLTYTATGSIGVINPLLGDECDAFPLTETGTRCGNGTVDAGEACDDGNLTAGDGCSPTCRVEPCWTCAGDPSACTPFAGGACDDGNACTTGDACTSPGVCAGSAVVCEACFACDASTGCVPRPRTPCKASTQPARSRLALKNLSDDARDRFNWTWARGAATTLAELGDPPGGAGYELCAYTGAGTTPALLFRAALPGDGTCGGVPCWRSKGAKGFTYRNRDATPEGVVVGRLVPGAAGKAAVAVKASGVDLSDHAYPWPGLPVATPLRVQLQGESGLCVESTYDASGVSRNDPASGVFKARGTP